MLALDKAPRLFLNYLARLRRGQKDAEATHFDNGNRVDKFNLYFPHNFPYNINRMKQIPLSISAQHLINFTFNIIFLISLTACLMGRNWARYLFLIVTLINISLGISLELVTPHPVYRSFWVICFSVVFGFIFYLITIFFLFRPKASAYFTGRGAISAE